MANPNSRGQQRDKPFRNAIRMEAALADNGEPTPAQPGSLRWIARKLLERAADETAAAKEIGDRLDGKPAQAIENGEDGAFEVIQRIERVIVKPPDQDG